MSKPVITINMVNSETTPRDVQHGVRPSERSAWSLPYNTPKSFTEHVRSYKKYQNFLSNVLFLQAEPYTSEFKALVEKAAIDRYVQFECTCYPNVCHMDALRERLTTALKDKGFDVVTNAKFDFPDSSDNDES